MAAYFIVFVGLLLASLILFKESRTKKLSCLILVLILVFEVFGANFYAVRSLFQKEQEFTVPVTSDNVSVYGNNTEIGGKTVTRTDGSKTVIAVSDINRRIVSVSLEMSSFSFDKTGNVGVNIAAADDSYSESFRTICAEKTVSPTVDAKVFPTELTGSCRKIRVSVYSENGSAVEVTALKFNAKIPFSFSILRLVATVLSVWTLYALIKLPLMKKQCLNEKKRFRSCVAVIAAIAVIAGAMLAIAASYNDFGSIGFDFSTTDGNQMTKELVDAFESGHLYLNDTPSDKLLKLENPYDWSQRNAAGITEKWDHLLYEGKFYSYYGIAPVLLLFLPFHALTGVYFSSIFAVMLFSLVGVVFLALLFREYSEKFFKKIPVGILLSSMIVIICSSGIWYSLCFSNFYEIAQSAGFMFTCGGFWLLLRSDVVCGGKIRLPSLALSSCMLSLAVLSRPTLALYCVTALVFIYFGLRKSMSDNKSKLFSKSSVKYLCCALIPYAVLGGIQCAYNFLRFGSPLDFGIQYSLTINDFTKSEFYADFFNISFYNFILAFPVIKQTFPFFYSNFSKLGANGYYFVANENAIGIFWRALPSLGIFATPLALKRLDKKERIGFFALLVPVCVVAPLIIIFSIWESGYGVRYCADFSWQLVLGGITVLFILYDRVFDKQLKSLSRVLFPVAALLAFAVNLALIFSYCDFSGALRDAALAFVDSMSLLS